MRFDRRNPAAALLLSSAAILLPAPIQEGTFVTLGGIEQWVTIRGSDRANPVLLLVHGGPGDAQSSLPRAYALYEKDFTIVQWDQRGAGKTYIANPASPPVPERVEADGIELAQYLCGHLEKKKILLLGHSWGSYLGVGMVQRRPDLFAAYIGTGQVGSFRASLQAQFDFMLSHARAAGDRKTVEQLEGIGKPAPGDATQYFSWWRMRNPYMPKDDAKWFEEMGALVKANSEISEKDLELFGAGMTFSGRTTVGAMLATDLPTTAAMFQVPVLVIQGKEDMVTPTAVAVQYFNVLKAPEKKLTLIDHAGHFALVTHPREFIAALVKNARPLAVKADSGR